MAPWPGLGVTTNGLFSALIPANLPKTDPMTLFAILLTLVLAILLYRWLEGESLSAFDKGYPKPVTGEPPSPQLHGVLQSVEAFTSVSAGSSRLSKERVRRLREAMDAVGGEQELVSQTRSPSEGSAPKGLWVLAPGADPNRRLLYVHGGGFIAGSPQSHRIVTDALARMTGMVVFSLDYRLTPEHPRLAGLEDTIHALKWLAGNGPNGSGDATKIAIAGDSAGGNLTLTAIQACRDQGLRMPDAAVAICPVTDISLTSPSLHFNRDSDAMLGKSFGPLAKIPSPIRHVILALAGRRRPADPALSPIRGDLTQLAPVLLQASTTEMLLDDSARYYHRARAQGAEVEFETYANMVHVWHLFHPELPEAQVAFQRIVDFLSRQDCCAPATESEVAQ